MNTLKRRTLLAVNTFIGSLVSVLTLSAQETEASRPRLMYGVPPVSQPSESTQIRVKYGVAPLTPQQIESNERFINDQLYANNADFTLRQGIRFARKGKWRFAGYDATPDKSTDMAQFATQYYRNQAVWDSVFNWLETHDLQNMPAGKYYVCDTILIKIQDANTREESRIESHRQYIDFQWTIRGTEVYNLYTWDQVAPNTNFNWQKDVLYFNEQPKAKPKVLRSKPNRFYLFFPNDPHKALLQHKKSEPIRKVVVKIPFVLESPQTH